MKLKLLLRMRVPPFGIVVKKLSLTGICGKSDTSTLRWIGKLNYFHSVFVQWLQLACAAYLLHLITVWHLRRQIEREFGTERSVRIWPLLTLRSPVQWLLMSFPHSSIRVTFSSVCIQRARQSGLAAISERLCSWLMRASADRSLTEPLHPFISPISLSLEGCLWKRMKQNAVRNQSCEINTHHAVYPQSEAWPRTAWWRRGWQEPKRES